jgi:putative transposase
MVSPEHKRRAVTSVLKLGLYSLRRACHYLGLSRSSYLYTPKARRDYELQLVDRIKQLSTDNPTYGYRCITELLTRDGSRVNRKKVQRICRAEGLIGH